MTVKKETIIRTLILLVTFLNQFLTSRGLNPLPWSESELYEIISLGITFIASLWAWWKNNSFTKEAMVADEYMKTLKTTGE